MMESIIIHIHCQAEKRIHLDAMLIIKDQVQFDCDKNVLKFSEMDTIIVMDIIFGMPITRQFVKQNGKPEQHQRSGVFRFFDFHGDNAGSNPAGDANQIQELSRCCGAVPFLLTAPYCIWFPTPQRKTPSMNKTIDNLSFHSVL